MVAVKTTSPERQAITRLGGGDTAFTSHTVEEAQIIASSPSLS